MSGGHFNGSGYVYYQVNQFADELENEIENNHEIDEFNYARNFNDEVIFELKKYIPELKKVSEIMRAIDYLYSGDDSEDSFLRKIKNINSK